MAKESQKRASSVEADLPHWDLSGLFPSKDSVELKQALADVAAAAEKFHTAYSEKISGLSAVELAQSIESFEDIQSRISRIRSYAEMTAAADTRHTLWEEGIQEKLRSTESRIIFFKVAVNAIEETTLIEHMAEPALAVHARFLSSLRSFRPYTLKDQSGAPDIVTEAYDFEKTELSKKSWKRLYDLTLREIQGKVARKTYNLDELENIIQCSSDSEKRHAAWEAISDAVVKHEGTLSLVFNTLADLRLADNRLRGFHAPETEELLRNRLTTSSADALLGAAQNYHASLSQRYFTWKSKKLGVTRLHPADCHVSLSDSKTGKTSWGEAQKIIVDAFTAFSPVVGEAAQSFFSARHIAHVGGSWGIYPADVSGIPYALVNFSGTIRDVLKLGSITAKAVHMILASEQKGTCNRIAPALLETSGTLGEMFVFNALQAKAAYPAAKRDAYVAMVENMLHSALQSASQIEFEKKLHHARSKDELLPNDIGSLWKKAQAEYCGPAVNLDVVGGDKMWAMSRGFVREPFMAPVRIFGFGLGMEIFESYIAVADKDVFARKCVMMLKAGASASESEVLKTFSIRPQEENDWKRGFRALRRHLDRMIELDEAAMKPAVPFIERRP